MQILNRYIRNMVVSATGFVVLILIGMNCLIELMTEIHDVGKEHYTIPVMCQYILMHIPAVVYTMFPISVFVGCLLGLGRLATGSELTVMQANGVSVAQVTWSVIKAAIVMSIFVSAIGEMIAPKWQQDAAIMKAQALNNQGFFKSLNQIWLRYGGNYLYIDRVSNATEISGVSEFIFQQHQLQEILFAELGKKVGNHWQLIHVSKTIVHGDHIEKQHQDMDWLECNFVPNQLQPFNNSLNGTAINLQGSVVNLWHTITYQKSVGLLTTLFELLFWQRVIQPMTTLIMICLGIPFIFGSLRNVSATVRLVTGVAAGIIFYMLNRFFGPITLIYQLPPFLGAIGPTVFFLGIYIYMTLRRS